MTRIIRMFLWAAVAATTSAQAADRVLIYTRNGKGYVHENIAAGVKALRELCAAEGIESEVSDQASVFTAENLKSYRAVIFANSNNEAFDTAAQGEAFRGFIRAGGGFVGIHSASGSERTNDYFRAVLGGRFKWHTPHGPFKIVVTDRTHPATAHLPATWEWKDEGYLCDGLNPNLHILLEMDLTSVPKPPREKWPMKIEGQRYPLAWCQTFDGGRQFYTALGHDPAHYADPALRRHLIGGILWVLNREPKVAPAEAPKPESKEDQP